MKITILFTLALLTLSSASLTAAELAYPPDSPFRVYSVADGLNQKSVLAVAQDHDGFLWVATFGGLNRFDGQRFESFTTSQGLRQNLIQGLMVDSKNRLWAGDAAGGLTLIENGRVIRTFEPDETARGVARGLLEFGNTLYVGTQPGGMRSLQLDDLDAGFTTIEDAPNEVYLFKRRHADEILVLGVDGVHSFRPNSKPMFELIAKDVSAFTQDSNGRYAIGDKSGRVGWLNDDNSIEWLDIQYGGAITGLIIEDGEIIWAIAEGHGMMRFGDPDADTLLRTGGTAPPLFDAEGVLWVPARAGLARYLGDRFRHYSLEFEGVRPEVFSIRPGTNNDFWFGTSLGLIHVASDGTLSNISDELGIVRREVREVRFSGDNKTLWAAHVQAPTYGIDLDTMAIRRTIGDEDSVVVSMSIDDQDRLWLGSYLGTLTVFDDQTGDSRVIEIGNGASVYSSDYTAEGVLWFSANYEGVFRIDTRDPEAQPELIVSDDILNQEVLTQIIARKSNGRTTLWFSSIQGVVFRWQNGEVQRIIDESVLAEQTIYSIAPLPDNTLVLATSRGAYRYDLTTKALEQYSALDGFVAIESKVHANYFDGKTSLMIGTTSGVTIMDVSQPMDPVGQPIPLIKRLTVDDVDIETTGDLPPGMAANKVTINFTAVSTRKPTGVEFSSRLDGQDTSWSAPSELTSVGYSNLSPGPYKFNLRARLRGGEWSAPATWAFTVPTPFWRTSWFTACALLTIIALIFSGIRLRLRSIARINQRLRVEVAERTESIESGRHELELINQQLSSEMFERQKADAMRAEVEARFRQAYENSPIGMALVDADGLIFDANPCMRTMFWPQTSGDDREPLADVVAEADRSDFFTFLGTYANGTAEAASMEVECLAHGGDVRRIDFHPSAVRDQNGSMQYIVLLAHDVTESRAMTDQLAYQARFDELTGLVNRRAFTERLEALESNDDTAGHTFLMFLDLDQFKVVNDTCGHAAGDELLRKVAKLITSCVREEDIVARLGGDEFALIIVGCTEDIALQRAENIRQEIQDLEFLWGQDVFRIGVSIGVVPISKTSQDWNELQQLADAACYAAKDAGRNRVHLVTGKADAVHEHRVEMRWVQRLNHAIDTDSFELFGQRIARLSPTTNHPERFEILLRMRDRNSNRLIPPGAFLPAAERYGLQGRLDQWVVNNVISLLVSQDPSQITNQQFWVNLSGASVGDSNISHALVDIVKSANLPAGCLNFEITETAVIRKIDDAAELIESLQAIGCRFALDDFGSGLSSFGYLKRLNVDCLKIDGQFVRDIVTDPTDRIFVKSIIDIAHTLGMRVVAEFVEDQDILNMVAELGSDYAQGFGIHRPAPLAQLVAVPDNTVEAGLGSA